MINLSGGHANAAPSRGRMRCAAAAAMLAAASAGAHAAAPANGGEDRLEEHQQELETIERRLADLRATLSNRERDREALFAQLRRYEQDIADLARAGHQLSAMIAAQEREIAALDQRLGAARAALTEARAALAELVRSAYAAGPGEHLRLLLDREDLRRIGRVFGYYRALGQRRAERVDEVRRLRGELAALRAETAGESLRLQRLAARQEATRQRLAETRAARRAVLADLDAVIAEERRRAEALRADARALRGLIERLEQQAEIRPELDLMPAAIAEQQGELHWPLDEARLLRRFGEGRERGALHADGVLLAATPGSKVRAIHHGRVVYADWLRGFGMLLVIDHGEGYLSLYGHNQSLLKEVGEWVAAGDVVALAGNSGGRDGQGLYFAIRRAGKALDPAAWCRRTAAL